MGIGIVLLFWLIVGVVVAKLGSVVLYRIAFEVTRGNIRYSPALTRAVRMFPFVCLVWTGILLEISMDVSETYLHRDAGVGDAWRCPLPNGYAILMIDTPDRGVVFNPRTQPPHGVGERSDTARASAIQVAGPLIFGRATGNLDSTYGYFILDTTRGTRTEVATYEDLREFAAARHVELHLESMETTYHRYRYTWFDTVINTGLFAFPLCCAIPLFRSVWRVRQQAPAYSR